MKYAIVITECDEGGYWAEVPELPGCVSQGETLEELKVNVREAINGYLEEVVADRRKPVKLRVIFDEVLI